MTTSVDLTIKLPPELVRDADEFGLLTEETVAQLLREAVDQRVNDLVNEEIHVQRSPSVLPPEAQSLRLRNQAA